MRTKIVFLVLLMLIVRNTVPFSVIDMVVPRPFVPGGELPDGAICSDVGYSATDLYCYSVDYRYSYVFDREYGRIDRTTFSVKNYRIGDFILAWGTPDGVMRYTGEITQVMWGVRTVWVIGVFTPQAKVVLYEEYAEPPPSAIWEGFLDYSVFLTGK